MDQNVMLMTSSQTGSATILQQLLEKDIIQRPIFSLMLINGCEGVLSLGGTAAPAVEKVAGQTRHELDHLGMIERGEAIPVNDDDEQHLQLPMSQNDLSDTKALVKRARTQKEVVPRQASWEDEWAWSKVQGAEGWWQILIQSIYVDGAKVLQNQAAVIDVSLLDEMDCSTSILTAISRSTAHLFLRRHSPRKRFTPPSLVRGHCRHLTTITMPFRA